MDPDLTIVLLGKSGAGKSASGNTILGRAAFESRLSFKPVTTEICEKTGQVFRKMISVIDTPGILESEEQIKKYCMNLLQSSRPVLFLVVIRVGRFTKEEQEAVDAAIRALGPQGVKKSYLLFTGGDILKKMSLDDFIFEENEGSLPDVVMKFGGACHLLNNENEDEKQVECLLMKAGHLYPDTSVPVDPVDQVQRRIVLIGRPGGGKSSSGNSILGSERFRSGCDFDSVSTETVSESAEVEGRWVTVVDTPGFTDEVLTPEQLYLEVMKSVVAVSPGPHVFAIVVRIGRISAADKKLFELLPILFGSDASKYTMVLFTHADDLRGRSMDDLIHSNSCVSDLVSMCGGRYCVFDNTKRGNRQQVRDFLRRTDEMVEANRGEHCTSEITRMAETFMREEKYLSDHCEESNMPDNSDENTPLIDRHRRTTWERLKSFLLRHPKKIVCIGLIVAIIGGVGLGAAIGAGLGVVIGVAGAAAIGAGGGAAIGVGVVYGAERAVGGGVNGEVAKRRVKKDKLS